MIETGDFLAVMRVLDKAYPRFKLDEETTEVYYQILGDLPLELLKAAVIDYVSSDSPWCPSAGQLRAAAFRLVEHEEGKKSAGEAWGEVMRKVGEEGYICAPQFDDPLIARALQGIGGWRELCFSPEEHLMAARARFFQVYETLQERQRHERRMLPAVRETVARLAAGGFMEIGAGDEHGAKMQKL
jgi:hypothetical protein